MEKLKQKRLGNKGFTLIELIIVIAIMAVLLGLVGTQVIPYLERSREAKDLQIINSYCTAAVTAYTLHVEEIDKEQSFDKDMNVYGDATSFSDAGQAVVNEIRALTYKDKPDFTVIMQSEKGQTINDIRISFNFGTMTITAQAVDENGNSVFESVISYI